MAPERVELGARSAVAVAAERAEPLAWRPADDDVRGRERARLRDVALVHMVAEVRAVHRERRRLDLHSEDGLEPPGLHEAARHPADASKEVDDTERLLGAHEDHHGDGIGRTLAGSN